MGPADLKAFQRFLQVLYFALFATVGMYWVVLELLGPSIEPRDVGPVKMALQGIAGGTALGVLYLRFARLGPLLADTTADPAQLLPRLRLHYILCYTLSEAVALYGLVLRLLGASREEVVAFFAAAVILFALCYPRPPQTLGGSSYP